MIRLSKRLAVIAHYVPLGTVVADIGTDHALLPSFLVQEKISPAAVAIDVHEGPLEAARKQVRALLLADKISVRLGDGLEPLGENEIQTVVIAGMGGSTIVKILNKSPDILKGLQRLILQPNIAAESLRSWALDNNWQIVDEELVYEDGRYYEIIILEPGKMTLEDDIFLFLGEKLLDKFHPLLIDYLKNQKRVEQEILHQLEKSNSKDAQEKANDILRKWIKVEQVIKWRLNVVI
ncbi:MAG: tRNA (adenine(22)-N(1))-methyltransferase [Peptococcaceae bacterium]